MEAPQHAEPQAKPRCPQHAKHAKHAKPRSINQAASSPKKKLHTSPVSSPSCRSTTSSACGRHGHDRCLFTAASTKIGEKGQLILPAAACASLPLKFPASSDPCFPRLKAASEGLKAGSSGSRGGSFEKLGLDLGALIHVPDEDYSDLTIIAGGKKVPVHRCILAARCPGLRKVLRKTEESGNSKRELQLTSVVQNGTIGYEAFMAVIEYVYGGKLQPWPVAIPCYESSCSHFTCHPAINYVLEILCAPQFFNLPEVKTIAEHHLVDNMGKFQVDDMLHIHQSVYITDCTQLQLACVTALASSALDNLTLDKEFSDQLWSK